MKNFRERIIEQFRKAENSVQIAVGLFTDQRLIEELISLTERGVTVEIILSHDEWNLIRYFDFYKLRGSSGIVRIFGPTGFKEMDFLNFNSCIIDGKVTLEGPPDLTKNFMALKGELRVDKNPAWSGEIRSEFQEMLAESKDYFTFYKNSQTIAKKLIFLEKKGLGPKKYHLVKNDLKLTAALAILES